MKVASSRCSSCRTGYGLRDCEGSLWGFPKIRGSFLGGSIARGLGSRDLGLRCLGFRVQGLGALKHPPLPATTRWQMTCATCEQGSVEDGTWRVRGT